MPKSNTNTQPLQIRAKTITRRVIPALQVEIGEAPADLLLQLDHWIATEGTNGTVTISARQIVARAFPLWSIRKTQRTTQRLAALGLITVTYATPGGQPTLALNLTGILLLKSVTLATPSPVTHPPVMGDAPPSPVTHPPVMGDAPPSPVTHPPVMGDAPPSPVTHPPVMGDAPPVPEPPSPVTHPHLIYDQKEKEESSVLLPSVGVLKGPPTHDMINELASLCQLDLNLNAERLAAHAAQLAEAGYTAIDIHDLAFYWHRLDYRSHKNGSNPPFLTQIAQIIKQALEHPEIKRRRALRAEGKEPDQDELTQIYNRYTSGPYSDIVKS